MLVNNAGFASVAPLLEADIRKMQDMIALNVTALTRLTYAPLLPSLSVGQARSSTSAPPRASR
jgi:short-subunit dehydrogenase